MRTKIIEPDSRCLANGERLVTPFVKTARGYEPDDRKQKTAACDEAVYFASKVTSKPGVRVILVVSFGIMEVWGANKKGDAFPESAVLGQWPKTIDKDYFLRNHASRIPKQWGIDTFVTKFDSQGNQIGGGNTFYEHKNKIPMGLLGKPYDPKNPIDPRCGYILASFYNRSMGRVEVIQEVWEHKLPKYTEQIDHGIMPGISMACNIPFDRCNICNNLAVSEADYCEHLNRRSIRRGAVLESGKGVWMLNEFPVFTDNTITDNPAAEEGEGLIKVASVSKPVDIIPTKKIQAELSFTDLEKAKRLQTYRLNEQPFSNDIVQHLRRYPLYDIFKYLAMMGIYPTGEDVVNIALPKATKKAGLLSEVLLPEAVSGNIDIPSIVEVAPEYNVPIYTGDTELFNISKFQDIYKSVKTASYSKGLIHMPFRKSASMVGIDINSISRNDYKDALVLLALRSLVDPYVRNVLKSLHGNSAYSQILSDNIINPVDIDDMPIYSIITPRQIKKLYS